MNALSLSFLPTALWWPVAVVLSIILVASAAAWLVWRAPRHNDIAAAAEHDRHRAWVVRGFLIFATLWWLFGSAVALWPLHGLDTFTQWARASSYVTVPLWIGGIAWAAALLVARLLRTARAP